MSPTVPPISTKADIGIAGTQLHALFDLVRNVRNHLYGRAQVITAPLFSDNRFVDSTRCEVAVTTAFGGPHKSLVVSEIEIGLCAIVRDENLAMLKRAHRAGIHVDIRIQLDHADCQAPRFQIARQGRQM